MALTEYNFETLDHCGICLNILTAEETVPVITHVFGPTSKWQASTNVGDASGQRRWSLKATLLPEDDRYTISGVRGADEEAFEETWHTYLWEFYRRHRAAGNRPFYIYDPLLQRRFLVSFANLSLTFDRMSSIFAACSDDIQLEQRQVEGMYFSAFDGAVIDESFLAAKEPWGWYKNPFGDLFEQPFPGGVAWLDRSGNERYLYTGGSYDVLAVDDVQNGYSVARLGSIIGDALLLGPEEPAEFAHVILVTQVREAAFSNASGVFSNANSEDPILKGITAGTKFFDFDYSATIDFHYAKNGVAFAESNQQAPMAEFGVIKVSSDDGFFVSQIQLGLDRSDTDTFGLLDYGEIYLIATNNTVCSNNDAADIAGFLKKKWL